MTPSSVSLTAGQWTHFEATVRGTNLPGVTWSITPPIGMLVNGIYTAPSTISSPQAVTVVVRSLADPTRTASATVFLAATVGIAVAPPSISLAAGQSATFQASIGGTYNTSVEWSLDPLVGTITNGVYTAPAIINTLQTIVLTAASLADPSKTAHASVTLKPSLPASVSVSPSQTTLGPSKSQQFTATIQGGTAAVIWSVSPSVGSISPSGLYTAPSALSGQQTVIIKAAISSEPTKTASAVVSLAGPTPPPPVPPIQLPLEVIGLDGTMLTTPFNIPASANLSGALTLSMQIHGLRNEAQASVQMNNLGWQPISHSTVTLLGNAAAYGGIGGGFSTLKMKMNVAAGTIRSGMNTISFRFNGTDGRVSGFRVLSFNFLDASGNSLVPAAAFVYEDPNTWEPPSSQASDIAAGKTLWYTATLTRPTSNGPAAILAHCTDCHAQDGRDLKYFNYSNNSIRTRSMFHGLTAQQGNQIASYIRTLNVVNPGRPWNPPYQPGPGLDSKPVIEWAAGAGLDAVLDSDAEMMSAMFPSGVQDSFFSASGNLNIRETPVAVQMPDWNQWLPGTHPMDAFGATFTGSAYNTVYPTLRANLKVLDPTAYVAMKPTLVKWQDGFYTVYQTVGAPIWTNPTGWNPATVDAMSSLPQWGMVKTWELLNEFQLEGFGQSIFGSTQADQRTWYSALPFSTSPHIVKLDPNHAAGLRNGTPAVYFYVAYIWYHMQLILNNSNKQQGDHSPIDWGYSYGFVKGLSVLSSPQAGLQTMWLTKALQISNNGKGPEYTTSGWQPIVNEIQLLVFPEANHFEWGGVATSTRIAVNTGLLRSWLASVTQFTPQEFYAGGVASPTVNPLGGWANGTFQDGIWYMIPRFKFLGVDPTLVAQVAAWAQTLWPTANWTADLNATCWPYQSYASDGTVACSQ
ncbi:MAG TPA: hypothetical protein VNV82_15910 [Bryobacteraceae bacterium]|nr:hypothetical protein [Bryobacteraceae bacterium]